MKLTHFVILLVVFVISFAAAAPTGGHSQAALYVFLASGTCLFLMLYFAPAMHAHKIRHPDRSLVLLGNLLFGWTVIGWAAAFVVACNGKQRNAPPPLPCDTRTGGGGLKERILEIDRLRAEGIISEEEYQAKRSKILS